MIRQNLEQLNYKELTREERDKWAHGSIFFKQEKMNKKLRLQSYLNYINSEGESKEKQLTNPYFDDLTKKLNMIHGFLDRILVKRKLLPKEVIEKMNK